MEKWGERGKGSLQGVFSYSYHSEQLLLNASEETWGASVEHITHISLRVTLLSSTLLTYNIRHEGQADWVIHELPLAIICDLLPLDKEI